MFNQGNETGKVSSAVGMGGFQLLPGNGDLVAIKNGAGGYLGGVKGNDKLLIVPHSQGWEQFFFETVDNGGRFALRQKESNHYLGGSDSVGQQPFLSNVRETNEIFTYSLLPNGMVTILNARNNRLGRDNNRATWSNQNTLSESWSFEMIQKSNNTSSTGVNFNTNTTNTTSTATFGLIPAPGSVVAIQYVNGGFIGKVKGKHNNLEIAPKAEGWEKFILEPRNNGKWAFKQQVSGLYVGGSYKKDDKVVLTDVCEACEMFELVPLKDGWLGIKGHTGTYMRSDGRNVLWQNVCEAGERWKLVPDVVPNQFQPGGMQGANTNWGQNQNANWGQNQGQQGWNQGQGQGQWNQGQPGWDQGNQGQWNQGNQGNQGQWNQGQQGQWNQGQPGWNQGQSTGPQQGGGFIPDFLKNVQQHMHQSQNTGNQSNNPFNSFQGGFSG